MKIYRLLIAILLVAIAGENALAQVEEDSKTINLTANLKTTISLQLDEEDIVFDFITLDDYKNGLGRKGGEYLSKGAVSSTANWTLMFCATQDFLHTDGVSKMNLNNVGITATFEGNNRIINLTDFGTLVPIKNYYIPLLMNNIIDSNAGDYEDNKFTIYWEMGTQGRFMRKKSIFEQDLKKGSYSTEIEFVAFEVI